MKERRTFRREVRIKTRFKKKKKREALEYVCQYRAQLGRKGEIKEAGKRRDS